MRSGEDGHGSEMSGAGDNDTVTRVTARRGWHWGSVAAGISMSDVGMSRWCCRVAREGASRCTRASVWTFV